MQNLNTVSDIGNFLYKTLQLGNIAHNFEDGSLKAIVNRLLWWCLLDRGPNIGKVAHIKDELGDNWTSIIDYFENFIEYCLSQLDSHSKYRLRDTFRRGIKIQEILKRQKQLNHIMINGINKIKNYLIQWNSLGYQHRIMVINDYLRLKNILQQCANNREYIVNNRMYSFIQQSIQDIGIFFANNNMIPNRTINNINSNLQNRTNYFTGSQVNNRARNNNINNHIRLNQNNYNLSRRSMQNNNRQYEQINNNSQVRINNFFRQDYEQNRERRNRQNDQQQVEILMRLHRRNNNVNHINNSIESRINNVRRNDNIALQDNRQYNPNVRQHNINYNNIINSHNNIPNGSEENRQNDNNNNNLRVRINNFVGRNNNNNINNNNILRNNVNRRQSMVPRGGLLSRMIYNQQQQSNAIQHAIDNINLTYGRYRNVDNNLLLNGVFVDNGNNHYRVRLR